MAWTCAHSLVPLCLFIHSRLAALTRYSPTKCTGWGWKLTSAFLRKSINLTALKSVLSFDRSSHCRQQRSGCLIHSRKTLSNGVLVHATGTLIDFRFYFVSPQYNRFIVFSCVFHKHSYIEHEGAPHWIRHLMILKHLWLIWFFRTIQTFSKSTTWKSHW